MSRRVLCVLAGWMLSIVVGVPSAALGTTPAPDVAIPRLIQQLGSDQFFARERATRELVGFGIQAQVHLLKACRDASPEVRRRARLALSEIVKADYDLLLERFALEPSMADEDRLPGWTRFRSLAGETHSSRQLFVQMHRCEPELMRHLLDTPAVLGRMLETRCALLRQQLYQNDPQRRQDLDLGSLAALFFVASDVNVPLSTVTVTYLSNFSYRPAMATGLESEATREELRAILGAWVARPIDGPNGYQQMILGLRHGLKSALPSAVKILHGPGALPHVREYALLVVARFGSREELPLVEACLTDPAVCVTTHHENRQVGIQVRDIALAVALHLQGQPLRDYGFDRALADPFMVYQPHTLMFVSEQQRESSLQKFRDWSNRQRSQRTTASSAP